MPLIRRTIKELRDRIAGDLNSRLTGTEARLRRSNVGVLATVEAGVAHGLYGYLDYLAGQISVVSAEGKYLERRARERGIARKQADFAAGIITVTGQNGKVVPAGTIWQRSDGVEYLSAADGTIVAGTVDITVTAKEAGIDGNTDAGLTLSLVTSIEGVDSDAIVGANGITGGLDAESDEDLRTRLLHRIQYPPMGGSEYDYVRWALEVPGVTRAWCEPLWLGAGTVGVVFVMDNQAGSIIPGSAKIQEVLDYITSHPDPVTGKNIGKPVTADVTVLAPTAKALDLTIALTPNTAAVKTEVENEIKAFIKETGEPGVTLYLSQINEAISGAVGEKYHVLTSPAADVTHLSYGIPVFGAITWA